MSEETRNQKEDTRNGETHDTFLRELAHLEADNEKEEAETRELFKHSP
jgi:hypothetical protein